MIAAQNNRMKIIMTHILLESFIPAFHLFKFSPILVYQLLLLFINIINTFPNLFKMAVFI